MKRNSWKKRLAMIRSTIRICLSNEKFIVSGEGSIAKFLVFQKRKYDEKVRIWKKKRRKIKRYLHLHSRISFANSVVSSQRCFCNRKKNKRELIPRETSKLEFGEPCFHLSLSLCKKKKEGSLSIRKVSTNTNG